MAIDGQNAYLLATMLSGVCYGASYYTRSAPISDYCMANTFALGIFLVLYGIILYIMFAMNKPQQARKNAAMIIVTIMFVVATVVGSIFPRQYYHGC